MKYGQQNGAVRGHPPQQSDEKSAGRIFAMLAAAAAAAVVVVLAGVDIVVLQPQQRVEHMLAVVYSILVFVIFSVRGLQACAYASCRVPVSF